MGLMANDMMTYMVFFNFTIEQENKSEERN